MGSQTLRGLSESLWHLVPCVLCQSHGRVGVGRSPRSPLPPGLGLLTALRTPGAAGGLSTPWFATPEGPQSLVCCWTTAVGCGGWRTQEPESYFMQEESVGNSFSPKLSYSMLSYISL